jgi:modulator of FtsH protease
MSGYDPAQWQAFAVAVVGATAALTGLMFVAVSINLTRVLQFPSLPPLAMSALVQLVAAMLAAAFVLVPPSTSVLGGELAVEGLVVALVLVPVHLRVRESEYWSTLQWLLNRVIPSVLVPLLLLLAGIGVAQRVMGGLYLMAVAVLVSVLAALSYAWILLVEIQR